MKKFILAKLNTEKGNIDLIKIVFPTKRDAEMFLKGMQCMNLNGNWEIEEVEEL